MHAASHPFLKKQDSIQNRWAAEPDWHFKYGQPTPSCAQQNLGGVAETPLETSCHTAALAISLQLCRLESGCLCIIDQVS